jgi:hypothetical protein
MTSPAAPLALLFPGPVAQPASVPTAIAFNASRRDNADFFELFMASTNHCPFTSKVKTKRANFKNQFTA